MVGNVAGDFSVNLHYVLPDVVKEGDDGTLQLSLPLLSGFDFAINTMEFTVTLPGEITTEPAFSSGYHQADIEKDMIYSVSGASITGSFKKTLKDHETLVLTMLVDDTMFPQPVVDVKSTETAMNGALIFAAVALLYWLIFLRCRPAKRIRCAQPPQGFNAGQAGCVMRLQGANLSLMVLTWAQLGYILIFRDRSGRVVLYKQMEMGNERSDYEQWYFRKLFGKRTAVDTTGSAYGELCRTAARKPVGMGEMLQKFCGSLTIYRILLSGVGLCAGLCLALELGQDTQLQGLLIFALCTAGAVSAWLIQAWCADYYLKTRGKLWVALALAVVWLGIGIWAGRTDAGLIFALGIPVGGVLLAIGGRRTELGRQTKEQLLGLHHYLRTVSEDDLRRLCKQYPDYYHTLAPYAIALGAGKAFAKRFGKNPVPDCPYLVVEDAEFTTAAQWHDQLYATVKSMETNARRLPASTLRKITNQKR